MSNNIVQFNEEIIKWKIKELVRRSVEETLNGLLEAEAEKLTQAAAGSVKRGKSPCTEINFQITRTMLY